VLKFNVLGPLSVNIDGRRVDAGPRKRRTVLAVLLLSCNEPVPVAEIMAAIWADDPPITAQNVVQAYVSALRRTLEPDRLSRTRDGRISSFAGGYVLRADDDEVDLLEFRKIQRAARDAHRNNKLEAAIGLYERALNLWRGQCLSDVFLTHHFDARLFEVYEEWRRAVLALGSIATRLGRHEVALPHLTAAVAKEPMNEALYAQLIVALAAVGRQADAFDAYSSIRTRLADELGMDPGRDLQIAHQRVLLHDFHQAQAAMSSSPKVLSPESIVGGTTQGPPRFASVASPSQLPNDLPDFTGRKEELDAILAYVAADRQTLKASGSAPMWAVTGPGGIGKTALVVHAAHLLREAFPDGQLFVDLRGVDSKPALPTEVLARFLRSLGVPNTTIPEDASERAALYRSALSSRRMLIVLDNAQNGSQLLPILPGSPGCAVLATSRVTLSDVDGMRVLRLGVLTEKDAAMLLDRTVADRRVAADPVGAASVVASCGNLPLALRIAGSRLAARPTWTVQDLANRLADEDRRLDGLEQRDRAVRASLSLGYNGLDACQRRALNLLALFQASEFSAAAASALIGDAVTTVETLLEHLVDISVLDSPRAGHYRYHDLTRLYAREQAAKEGHDTEWALALTRLLTFYASRLERLSPQLSPSVPEDRATTDEPGFDSWTSGAAWWAGEQSSVLIAIQQAVALGGPIEMRAIEIIDSSWLLFEHAGLSADLYQLASKLAPRNGVVSPRVTVLVEKLIGNALLRRYDVPAAIEHLNRGLKAAMECSDEKNQARILNLLGRARFMRGRYLEAISFYRKSLESFRQWAGVFGEAAVLGNIGEAYLAYGCREASYDALTESVRVCRKIGEPGPRWEFTANIVEAASSHHLGVLIRASEPDAAIDHFTHALQLYRKANSIDGEATVLIDLGTAYRRAGRLDDAAAAAEQGVAILRRIHDPLRLARALRQLGVTSEMLGDSNRADQCRREVRRIFSTFNALGQLSAPPDDD
jgi:DNA-binding SARP family transcriptional activator